MNAKKAFDKVWRDGLFFKLINKMDHSLWHLLKIFYDNSHGSFELEDESNYIVFPINIGVKQGGILSPTLFQIFIDDLIYNCTNIYIGSEFKIYNMSIIVYAHDIILSTPVDSHLQKLLDICDEYSKKWKLNFNASKSKIVEFGKQFFNDSSFTINNQTIPKSDNFTYLGVNINKNLDFNKEAIKKFGNTQKSVFSLTFLGLKPNTITPHLQSFIYKTFCLSQFTYSLETTVINTQTRNYLHICQNNLLRQIIGLNKFCQIQWNNLPYFWLSRSNGKKKFSKSFIQDIKLLEERLSSIIFYIYRESEDYKKSLKNKFIEREFLILSTLVSETLKLNHIG